MHDAQFSGGTTERFIARIDRLEKRYGRDRYATRYLVPADELKAVRDQLKSATIKTDETAELPLFREAVK